MNFFNEYLFLSCIALIWIGIASIQDIRKTIIPNWLSFSLIAFGLVYKLFYSISSGEMIFFIYGVIGFALFFVLSYLFYYSKIFGGGDAKLLMGVGAILPYDNLFELIYLGAVFIFLLFFIGGVWGLIYGVGIAIKRKKVFELEVRRNIREKKWRIISVILFGIVFGLLGGSLWFWLISFCFFVFVGFMLIYVYALDKCLVVEKNPKELIEGDWLEKEIRVRGKVIKKSVHGLSIEEIEFLKKAKKNAVIKEGIPFVPAFFIALAVTLFFSSELLVFLQNLFFQF